MDLLNHQKTKTVKLAKRGAHYIRPNLRYIPGPNYQSVSQWHLEQYPFMRMNPVMAHKLGLSPK